MNDREFVPERCMEYVGGKWQECNDERKYYISGLYLVGVSQTDPYVTFATEQECQKAAYIAKQAYEQGFKDAQYRLRKALGIS